MLRNVEVICDGTVGPRLTTMMMRDRGGFAQLAEPVLSRGRPFAPGTRCPLGTRLDQAALHHAVESGTVQQY